MKKKALCLLLGVGMVLGLAACGAGGGSASKVLTLKWDGDKYDLSGDFQKVVGKMVEDGHVVVGSRNNGLFDEDGKFAGSAMKVLTSGELDDGLCYAFEAPIDMSMQVSSLIESFYSIGFREEEYETADGITGESSRSDIKDLDGYVKVRQQRGGEAFAAMYMDGKRVDLDEYEDKLDDYLDMLNEEGVAEAKKEFFPTPIVGIFQYAVPGSMGMKAVMTGGDGQEVDYKEMFREYQSQWGAENMLTMALVAQEAAEALEDGDIKSYSVIVYEYFDDDGEDKVQTSIYIYTYDEDYDIGKFQKKK